MRRNPSPCNICPSRFLCNDEFNVVNPDFRNYQVGESGYRVNDQGEPTCIHPTKVELPLRRLTRKVIQIDTTSIPADPGELVPWMAAQLDPEDPSLQEAVDQITDRTTEHYPEEVVLEATRRALSCHMDS